MELDLRLKAGEIADYTRQVIFALYGKNGGHVCNHVVDFLIVYPDGTRTVEDFKGVKTAAWAIKRKLFEDNHPKIKYIVRTKA